MSYSRKDRERAQGIADALRSRHFGVFRDTEDILPTEEWRERLQQLIEEADTIVFLMSPQSIASEVCAWEVEYATSLNKRIAPIVIEEVEGSAIPPLLSRLNFIFCTERDPFENAIDTLSSALSTDIDWVREHTRLSGLARRWQDAGRPKRLLLRGQDIADAEAWRDSRPKDSPDITEAHIALIRESRRASQARQRGWIAGSIAVALITAGLSVFAWLQSIEAESQRVEADIQRAEAERQRATAESERDRAEAERQRAEEQRDLAERRLREALVQRTRRNLSDATALIGDGAHTRAAPMVRDALETAQSLDDAPLLKNGAAVARQLLFTDRFLGYLETAPAPPIGFAETSMGPKGSFIATRHLLDLKVWSFRTGDVTPLAVPDVEAIAWLDNGQLAAVRSKRQPGAWGSLTVFDPGTGEVVAETDYDRQFADAVIHPAQDIVIASEYRDGDHRTLALRLSDGSVMFDLAAPAQFEAVAVSGDGEFVALAYRNPDRVELRDRRGSLVDEHVARAGGLVFVPADRQLAFKAQDSWWLWAAGQSPVRIFSGGEPAEDMLLLGDGRLVARADQNSVSLTSAADPASGTPLSVSTVFGLAGVANGGERFILRHEQQFSVLDGQSGELVHRIGRNAPPAGGFHLSGDGRYLAIVHQDGFVSVWSTGNGRDVLAVNPDGGASWIQILERPAGPVLAVHDGKGRLGLWRIEPFDLTFGGGLSATAAPRGDTVAVNGRYGEPLTYWDMASASAVRTIDDAVQLSADPASGRELLRLSGFRMAVLSRDGIAPVPLEGGERFESSRVAWGSYGLLALVSNDGIGIFRTSSGERLAMIDAESGAGARHVRKMSFLPEGRLAVLTDDARLLLASIEKGGLDATRTLPSEASDMYFSGSGKSALLVHRKGLWRHDTETGTTVPFGEQDGTVRIVAAGPHSAVLHRFGDETRTSWLIDLETGEKRFDLDWGAAYAMGAQDRIIVSEDARGEVAVRNAQTGRVLHRIPGDGGSTPVPARPFLGAEEHWMIGVNGGADMFRLIDTATGEVRASVPRRESLGGVFRPSADFSAVTVSDVARPAVVDLSDAMLGPDGLLTAIRMRFPEEVETREADTADECDRLAAFVNDPEARTDGVAYDRIPPEALVVCGEAAGAADPDPVTLFQLARAATLHAPQRDGETAKLLAGLADQGYAAAGYTLAVLMLQGRAPGDKQALIRRLREAAEGGAGIAWIVLSRMADAGHLDEPSRDLLQRGVDAGLPAVLEHRARALARDGNDFRAAAAVARRAAEAYLSRHQSTAAGNLLERSAAYARRSRR
ncbi:TIR domain-containing protein [Minwuia thermotolerans]|uniref:TIR domain-containing protein n=1 Tax=Minwuia thermotolerans TaxID=2056226 RepID=A0A2M9G369_9PROT|nr:TIR domain-containing protein [Minwuia thermotolerans]PJK30169.1 hypothetical protein CVT23_07145 [Minwuia thermotolerans]